jgi:molecular chaperone GrpE
VTDAVPSTIHDGDAGAPEERMRDVDVDVKDLEDQLLRARADLDNLRKRYDREIARERSAERSRVASGWLPVIDDLERALQHAEGEAGALIADGVLEGLRAVHEHAVGTLARLGFPQFIDIGEVFDPSRHEAIATVENESAPGTVVAAVRPGYGTRDDMLRPASVVVSKGRSEGRG